MANWKITSWLYQYFRKLPPFKTILQAENANLKQLLSELPTAPKVILDLGSGHGNAGTIFFQNNPVSPRLFIAIDHEWAMLRQLTPGLVCCPCRGSAEAIPLKNASVHLVLAIGLTEYIADHAKLLTEINRVMAPDSSIVITIAPPGIANYLRNLLGHTLHLISAEKFLGQVEKAGFQREQTAKSWLQIQFLLKKSGEPN